MNKNSSSKMIMLKKFRLWVLDKLLGESEEINREVEYTYADIWPKHECYEKRNKMVIKEAIIRARRDSIKAEQESSERRKEMEK